MPVTTRSVSAEAQTKMHLRSGKVLCGVAEDQKKKKSNINKFSVVEEAKNQVRQRVKARQRDTLERLSNNKSVDEVIDVLNSYVVAFAEIDNNEDSAVDPIMEKIRLITKMYGYLNSVSTHTMMHNRLNPVRDVMLKQCVNFSNEAKEKIDIRVKYALETMPGRNPGRYYTIHFDNMQEQLDNFTNTYKCSV